MQQRDHAGFIQAISFSGSRILLERQCVGTFVNTAGIKKAASRSGTVVQLPDTGVSFTKRRTSVSTAAATCSADPSTRSSDCVVGHHLPTTPVRPLIGFTDRGCQLAGLAEARETGLMWANMLRAFQVGKARTSDGEPSS